MTDNECGAIGGVIGEGSRSTGRKRAPMLLRPPQIPNDLTYARIRVAAARRQRLIS
jgi:hypothetical protein